MRSYCATSVALVRRADLGRVLGADHLGSDFWPPLREAGAETETIRADFAPYRSS